VNNINADSVKWKFGDDASGIATQSNLFNPQHKFTSDSSFEITCTIYSFCSTDTIKKSILIIKNNLSISKDTTMCEAQLLILKSNITNAHLLWNDGSTNTIQIVSGPGKY
jgi:hypothetical protein